MQAERYTRETLQKAIPAVRRNQLHIRQAVREFGVPPGKNDGPPGKKTTGPGTTTTGPKGYMYNPVLSTEEKCALVNYMYYMAKQGFPMTRAHVRCYIREIVRRSGRDATFNTETGPSDKRFRKFLRRHPQFSERTPENLDKARQRMSTEKTATEWFGFLKGVLQEHGVTNKPEQDGIPDSWLFATSESGYMDGELFLSWFSTIFVHNCGRERPVVLILDNHDSHVTLSLVEVARANNIVLVGLPAHTTHFLQPLDVKVIGPLKSRFSTMADNLGFASSQLVIGKAKFPVVLKYAIDQATPLWVKEGFSAMGIYPFNPEAIDKSQLVPPTFTTNNSEAVTTPAMATTTCVSFLTNPLVTQGLIPQSMAEILIPPPTKPATEKSKRVVAEGRVISGVEMLNQLKEKEAKVKAAEEAKIDRLVQKPERKEQKQKDEEEKKNKRQRREEERGAQKREKDDERMRRALGGKLASIVYTCGVCAVRGRVNDEGNGVAWYGCDVAGCGKVVSRRMFECRRKSAGAE